MYKQDLALNNLQRLMHHKTQPIIIWTKKQKTKKYFKLINEVVLI